MSFKRHLRAIPWLDKLVDVLVVILGISIAFGIDNWAEGRKNERTEQKYLRSLREDLAKDSASLAEISRNTDRLQSSIDTTIALYGDIAKADRIGYHVSALGGDMFFSPEDYTYQALKQSGDFSLIRDDSLQLALSRLHDVYERYEKLEETANQMMMRYLIDFFENYDAYKNQAVHPSMYNNQRFLFGVSVFDNNLGLRKRAAEDAMRRIEHVQQLIDESLPQ